MEGACHGDEAFTQLSGSSQCEGGTKSPAKGAKRYGYTAAHRRGDISPYSTNLTDAEWDLVADLFERAPGQRGTPVHYSRRELVNRLRSVHLRSPPNSLTTHRFST